MRHTQRAGRGVYLILLLPALLLPGCGANGDPGASAGEPVASAQLSNADFDPCELVTGAEAASALGIATVEADRPSESNGEKRSKSYSGGEDTVVRMRTCRYTGEKGQGLAVLVVMVRQSSSPTEAKTGFEGLRQTYAQSVGVTDVPGVGEQAFWADDFGVHVLSGGSQLTVSGDVDAGSARNLAARALDRLT